LRSWNSAGSIAASAIAMNRAKAASDAEARRRKEFKGQIPGDTQDDMRLPGGMSISWGSGEVFLDPL